MEFQQRLPQNFKETVLFMAIISIISVNLIAPIITGLEIGFSTQHYLTILPRLPLIWLAVIVLVVVTQKPAEKLAQYFLGDKPNFRSAMLITAVCNVFLMSLVLTILGAWIGTNQVSMVAFRNFPYAWPRNFTIALIVEAFIAQPLARSIMAAVHGNELMSVQK